MEFQFTYKTPHNPPTEDTCACEIVFAPNSHLNDKSAFTIHTGLPLIPPDDAVVEHLEFNPLASYKKGHYGRVNFIATDSWALIQINCSADLAAIDLAETTYQAYLELFKCLADLGVSQVARMWNYLANINLGQGDDEAYKLFCCGRLRAFKELNIPAQDFPAASALGRKIGGLQVYALATLKPCMPIENPVQTSAYCYPREYGPASPSFARATLAGLDQHTLFISGTASILNAQSHHLNDVFNQAELSCQNIQRVIRQATYQAGVLFRLALVKVYLRKAEDRAHVEVLVTELLGSQCDYVWLEADICRAELLIEIEGIAVRV